MNRWGGKSLDAGDILSSNQDRMYMKEKAVVIDKVYVETQEI